MTHPWANTLLLVFILAELVSGFFGLVSGSPDKAIFILAHRVSGYGILVVLVWKARNIRRSLRWRRAVAPRTASLVLTAILAATLVLGFAWSFIGPYGFSLFSGVSWHIYVGAAMLPLLIWHAIYHTRGFPISFWAERRSFLRLSGIIIAAAAFWRASEASASFGGLSGASRRFTGSYEASSFSGNNFPLTSWLNDNPLPVSLGQWNLRIHGAVERQMTLSYEDLLNDAELTATIDCTGGWNSTQVWRGVSLASLLDMAQPTSDASSVTIASITGYYRRFSLDEARRYILAVYVGNETLSHGHGFPLRLVAFDKRGFEWVKWVTSIKVNTTSKWWQPPLPLQ